MRLPRRTLVLGMGNPILSDDGFGLVVAERLRAVPLPQGVEVMQSEVAGLRLLELMRGFDKVIIVDAIQMGRPPGDIMRLTGENFRGGQRYGSAHSIGLQTALRLGEKLGYEMPSDVVAFAVEAQDVETFGEGLSPAVKAACDVVVRLVMAELESTEE
jgi:hydrogenase maturation protease